MSRLQHGKIVRLSGRLRRITAPNPGPMTGAGTNTYIVGENEVAVVDPGPADPSHIDAILNAAGDKLRWILVTHTHTDHSPAAAALANMSGAKKLGMLARDVAYQDTTFKPDQLLEHNQCLSTDEFSLRVIHTPGHVSNHLCFLLEEEGVLMAGDHIMNGSTVVIVPPHGEMKAYIDSLRLLTTYPLTTIAPAHGELMSNPISVLEGLVAHRLQREAKVFEKLSTLASATLSELVVEVYDDVDQRLHPMAILSLEAHLIKLQAEAKVMVNKTEPAIWRIS